MKIITPVDSALWMNLCTESSPVEKKIKNLATKLLHEFVDKALRGISL